MQEDSAAQGNQVVDLRRQAEGINREIEGVKLERAELWRENNSWKEQNEGRALQAAEQNDRMRRLDDDIVRTNARCNDTSTIIEVKNADLRAKQQQLEETQRDLNNTRVANHK